MAKAKLDIAPPLPPGVPPDGQPVGAEDATKPPPPFGTAKPAGSGTLPRVVPELARAGRGEQRFKMSLRMPTDSLRTRYVLAAVGDRARTEAEACYLAAERLTVAPDGGRLVVTELPD